MPEHMEKINLSEGIREPLDFLEEFVEVSFGLVTSW
jgi:hypothetical protein